MGQPYEPTRPEAGSHEQTPPDPTANNTPTGTPLDAAEKLAAARSGSSAAMGELFEQCRNYLLLIANAAVGKGLRARMGASDLVQETFLEAGTIFSRFQGNSEEDLLRWLTYILENKLGNTFKGQLWTAKRDPSRELHAGDAESVEFFEGLLVDSSPSASGAVATDEEGLRVQAAISQLSDDYQKVVNLRIYDRLSFDDVGRAMNRTGEAARKLFIRAIDELRVRLKSHDPSAN